MGYCNMESREYAAESTEVPATWNLLLFSENGESKYNTDPEVRTRFWIFSVWKYGY
jgi:hypothetical protein